MTTLPQRILNAVQLKPGMTDRQLADQLSGRGSPQQPINIAARALAAKGRLRRAKRQDGLIGNYVGNATLPDLGPMQARKNHDLAALSEDEIKEVLERWLVADGWTSKVAWGRTTGIDIDAKRGRERWIIEVKGPGSLPAMRVNYFLAMLGEVLQRMDAADVKYSIALPDLKQYRGLWERLPALAKARTTISLLLVNTAGKVDVLE
jgi:hypothetical protein